MPLTLLVDVIPNKVDFSEDDPEAKVYPDVNVTEEEIEEWVQCAGFGSTESFSYCCPPVMVSLSSLSRFAKPSSSCLPSSLLFRISHLLSCSFSHGLSSLPSSALAPTTALLVRILTHWSNSTPSSSASSALLFSLLRAFASLQSNARQFRIIAERRKLREMAREALNLLALPPESRKPPQVLKLLQYHAKSLAHVRDSSLFLSFPPLSKKSLLNLYSHARIKLSLPPNTPVFLQAHPGFSYFVLLKGSVGISRAGEKRLKEIDTEVESVMAGEWSTGWRVLSSPEPTVVLFLLSPESSAVCQFSLPSLLSRCAFFAICSFFGLYFCLLCLSPSLAPNLLRFLSIPPPSLSSLPRCAIFAIFAIHRSSLVATSS